MLDRILFLLVMFTIYDFIYSAGMCKKITRKSLKGKKVKCRNWKCKYKKDCDLSVYFDNSGIRYSEEDKG